MMEQQTILDILDKIRNRFYGKYRGYVTEVESDGRGRIKAKVPSVLGEHETGWCSPCVPYAGPNHGIAFLPEKDAGVWIEFEGGDVSFPIWSGCYWRDGQWPTDAGKTTQIIRTPAGHQIEFNGSSQDFLTSTLTITDRYGNTITMSTLGVTIKRTAGKIEILEAAVKIMDDGLVVTP